MRPPLLITDALPRAADVICVWVRPPHRAGSDHGAADVQSLNLGAPGAFDLTPWADRVRQIDARYAGVWELPVFGAVSAPTAVLMRPDGHVAWVGDGTDQGLRDALTTWFGPPKN